MIVPDYLCSGAENACIFASIDKRLDFCVFYLRVQRMVLPDIYI